MLIILAHNTTGTKADGTSEYDVELRVNDWTFAKFHIEGHIRKAGAAPLLRMIADRLEEQEKIEKKEKLNENL